MKSKKNNLLIVEDNAFIGRSIADSATKISNIEEVSLTQSIKEAIIFFEDANFELLILDLKLPDGEGIELLKTIKEKEIETKVFVFSVSTELKSYCLKYGAVAFFDKAKDFDELMDAIEKA